VAKDEQEKLRALLKRQLNEATLDKAAAHHQAKAGYALPPQAVEALRATLEASEEQDHEVDRLLAEAVGFPRRQTILDASAILLWGVSGSLIAAILWEHRSFVPPAVAAALAGATVVQFRAEFFRRPLWQRALVVLSAIAIVAYFAWPIRGALTNSTTLNGGAKVFDGGE
jgi:hypothetical protein